MTMAVDRSGGVLTAIFSGVLTGAAIILSGCSPSVEGAPRRAFAVSEEIAAIRQTYGPPSIAAYRSADPGQRTAIRDSIVLGRMYAIDLAYGEFEKALTRENQQVPYGATLASIALSGAGSIIADAATISLLAAMDTGLKGAGEAYEKKLLAGRTIETLQQTMRANRNRIRAAIVANLSLPDSRYPLELALGDVENYYNAGTVTGGMIGVSELASLRLSESNVLRENSATIGRYGPDEATEILRNYWRQNGADAARRINDWLASQSLPVTITEFLNVSAYSAKRLELVEFLGLRPGIVPRIGG
jgi:hypothetical protein